MLHTFTNTDTPEQNGVSERLDRTIANGVRCALIDSGSPTRFWLYAVEYFVQNKNASPHAAISHNVTTSHTPFGTARSRSMKCLNFLDVQQSLTMQMQKENGA